MTMPRPRPSSSMSPEAVRDSVPSDKREGRSSAEVINAVPLMRSRCPPEGSTVELRFRLLGNWRLARVMPPLQPTGDASVSGRRDPRQVLRGPSNRQLGVHLNAHL